MSSEVRTGAADVGVLVAGAGAAGLAAALAAAQGGSEVVVLETTEHFRESSNTAMSTSMVPAGGTRFQAAAGIEDSPEGFRADIRRKTAGTAEPVVTNALTEVAPELVHWLSDDVGVPLSLVTDILYPGHTTFRCHSVADRSGRTLHRHLLTRVESDGTGLLVPVRLVGVHEDPDPQRGVLTATLERPDGSKEQVTARAIILATSGFGADRDRVAQHTPEILSALYHGGDGARGDALTIGEHLGADVSHLDAYQGHGSVAIPHGIILTWATVMHGAVLIDRNGERFGDETVGYSEYGARVVERPGSIAWTVFDERVHEACLPFKDYQDIVASGAVTRHEDLAALAEAIGAPVDRLRATLESAAEAAHGGSDPHGRRDWEAALQPPYLTVRITGALFHTQGGLSVDSDARVLRRGRPIPGLYAAGGSAVGISGSGAGGYLAGNGLLAALGLGLLAGRHAAAQR